MGSPDVPIRIRRGIVQIHVGRVTVRAVVAVAADKGAKRARPHRAHTISLLFHFSVVCSYVPGEVSPRAPCAAYAAEGCSQEREAPTSQPACDAELYRLTQDASQLAPWPQPPPTRAIATIVRFIQ